MQTPPTNNTSKPMSEEEHGSADTKPLLQLDPWDIAHLWICERDEQPINIECATDEEFDAWVHANAFPVKVNEIKGWSFDDRCRLVNYVLAHDHSLECVDGTRIPTNMNSREEAEQDETHGSEDEHHPNRKKQRGDTIVVYALVDPRAKWREREIAWLQAYQEKRKGLSQSI